MPTPTTTTTSTLFLHTLASAGITHAFANWGSDHPALLEELARQRLRLATSTGSSSSSSTASTEPTSEPTTSEPTTPTTTAPKIITSPNEMVALSAAQGYAQTTGKPAAVFVHVDVGTQALAGAVHNVDRSRTPVLIYAGASPYSVGGREKGGRDEWIMWMQDVPDQSAIVRQYMRYTAQLPSGPSTPQFVRRALQIATSDPKGPVYLWARRETMESPLPLPLPLPTTTPTWPRTTPPALPARTLTHLTHALISAQSPLIITSSLGTNPHAIPPLLTLSSLLHIPICSVCPSAVNVPFSHPYGVPPTFLVRGTHTRHLGTADVVLVLGCEVPWIPGGEGEAPGEGARVFVLDGGDPLRRGVGYWDGAAEVVGIADPEVALGQIVDEVRRVAREDGRGAWGGERGEAEREARGARLRSEYAEMVRGLDEAEAAYPDPGVVTTANVVGVLRRKMVEMTPSQGEKTLVLNEAISNYPAVWAHLRPERAGAVISSGGSSLGWALGAAIGASLGAREHSHSGGYELVVAIVGDGSFLFGVPSTAYWMARKYSTPFLTLVLNNGGWKSPKLSMLRGHPAGHGSLLSGDELSVGFGPHAPDYGGIAVGASAGWAWGVRVQGGGREALERAVGEAVRLVVQEGRCAVVECVLEGI